MRAVTFDCTVLSSAAARFMPARRATASNTRRSDASIPALAPSSERAVEQAAVEQQVLAGDVAGAAAAQKRAGIAELGRIADPPGRHAVLAPLGHLLDRDAEGPGVGRDPRAIAVGVEQA